MRRAPIVLVAMVALAPAVRAHDMWLVPSAFAVAPEESVAVRLMIGHAGDAEPLPREDRRIVRFEHLGGRGAAPILGLDGRDPAGFLRPAEAGPLVLVYESKAAFSELPPDRFDAYAREEGLDAVLAARRRSDQGARPGRELYSRALKSLVRVGTGGDAADRPVGLPLELVLETVDAAEGDGSAEVGVRVLRSGAPLAGALVDIAPLGTGVPAAGGADAVRHLRTDADGALRVDLAAGRWMLSTVHAEPARGADGERAEWRTVFASLTFALGDA